MDVSNATALYVASKKEKDAIRKLRMVASMLKNDRAAQHITDDALLRFLKFHGGDFKKTSTSLSRHVEFRETHASVLQNARRGVPPPLYMRKYLSYMVSEFVGVDREGYPIVVFRGGAGDSKGLSKLCTLEDIFAAGVWSQEYMLQKLLPEYNATTLCPKTSASCPSSASKTATPKIQVTLIIDLEGIGMHFMSHSAISAVTQYMAMSVANYPEEFKRVFMVRAPKIFPVLFKAVTPFIPEKDIDMIRILDSVSYLDVLRTYIDDDQIPQILGGSNVLKRELPGGRIPIERILAPPTKENVYLVPVLETESPVQPTTLLQWVQPSFAASLGVDVEWHVQYCAKGYFTRWHDVPSDTVVERVRFAAPSSPSSAGDGREGEEDASDDDEDDVWQIKLRLGILRPGAEAYAIRLRAVVSRTRAVGPWLALPYFVLPRQTGVLRKSSNDEKEEVCWKRGDGDRSTGVVAGDGSPPSPTQFKYHPPGSIRPTTMAPIVGGLIVGGGV
eukprot:g2960.t1